MATRVAAVMATGVAVTAVTTASAAMAAMAATVAAAMVAASAVAASQRRQHGEAWRCWCGGGDGGNGGGSGGGKEAAMGLAALAAACGRMQGACGSESVQDRQNGRCMCQWCVQRGKRTPCSTGGGCIDDGPKAGPTRSRTPPAPTLSETGTPVWDLLNMAATAMEIQRQRRQEQRGSEGSSY